MIGWAVSCALLLAAIGWVGDAGRTAELWAWVDRLTVVMGIWLIAYPISYTLWPKRAKV